MKLVVQRVNEANVIVDSDIVGQIGRGMLVFVSVGQKDTTQEADYLV